MVWTEREEAISSAVAAQVIAAVRQVVGQFGVTSNVPVHGVIEALGILIRDDLADRPEQLALHLTMLKRLVDHVMAPQRPCVGPH